MPSPTVCNRWRVSPPNPQLVFTFASQLVGWEDLGNLNNLATNKKRRKSIGSPAPIVVAATLNYRSSNRSTRSQASREASLALSHANSLLVFFSQSVWSSGSASSNDWSG